MEEAVGDLLARVRDADEALEEAREVLQRAVDDARDAGASWQQIADTLGVRKQSAWQRFWRDASPVGSRTDDQTAETDRAARSARLSVNDQLGDASWSSWSVADKFQHGGADRLERGGPARSRAHTFGVRD